MQVTVFDRVSYKISERKVTDEGFLRVPGRVARTGIQEYLACELGLKDCDPMKIIKVMRPEEEVFSGDSLASYIGSDITIEHPTGFVDSIAYSSLSKGPVISAIRDGDFVRADLIIKSKDAIDAVNSGKVELSAGYTAKYEKAPAGSDYDYIQRNIKVNHVAIVDKARAGAQARIFDNKPTKKMEIKMAKITLDSGRSVELEDGATAALISDSFERLTQKMADSESGVQKLQATFDAQKEKLVKLEADLKASTDGSALKDKLAELTKVQDSAKRIAGKDFTCDSVDSMEWKREALAKVRDSIKWADKEDGYVSAAFDFADEDMSGKEKDEDEDEKKASKSKKQFSEDAALSTKTATVDSGQRRKFMDANAWKVTLGQLTADQLKAQSETLGGK